MVRVSIHLKQAPDPGPPCLRQSTRIFTASRFPMKIQLSGIAARWQLADPPGSSGPAVPKCLVTYCLTMSRSTTGHTHSVYRAYSCAQPCPRPSRPLPTHRRTESNFRSRKLHSWQVSPQGCHLLYCTYAPCRLEPGAPGSASGPAVRWTTHPGLRESLCDVCNGEVA